MITLVYGKTSYPLPVDSVSIARSASIQQVPTVGKRVIVRSSKTEKDLLRGVAVCHLGDEFELISREIRGKKVRISFRPNSSQDAFVGVYRESNRIQYAGIRTAEGASMLDDGGVVAYVNRVEIEFEVLGGELYER